MPKMCELENKNEKQTAASSVNSEQVKNFPGSFVVQLSLSHMVMMETPGQPSGQPQPHVSPWLGGFCGRDACPVCILNVTPAVGRLFPWSVSRRVCRAGIVILFHSVLCFLFNKCVVVCTCGLSSHSLVANDVKHFECLPASCVSSLMKCLSNHLPIVFIGFFCSYYLLARVLYIF